MGKKIIVIDDSQTIREQVATTLRKAGFEIVEAVDGVDGDGGHRAHARRGARHLRREHAEEERPRAARGPEDSERTSALPS